MVARDPFRSENRTLLDEWRNAGKRWLLPEGVPTYTLSADMTAEQAYEFWAKSLVYTDPIWNAIIINEFGLGDYSVEVYAPMAQAVSNWQRSFPGNVLSLLLEFV